MDRHVIRKWPLQACRAAWARLGKPPAGAAFHFAAHIAAELGEAFVGASPKPRRLAGAAFFSSLLFPDGPVRSGLILTSAGGEGIVENA
jgi:hypothetical protein